MGVGADDSVRPQGNDRLSSGPSGTPAPTKRLPATACRYGALRFFAGVLQLAAQLLSLRLAPLLATADPQLAEGIEIAEHFQWNSGQKPKRISDKPEQFVFSRMRIVVIQR